MSREQLKSKVTILHQDVRTLRKSLSKMKNFVTVVVEHKGEHVPEELHDICSKICSDEQDIIKEFKSDSPQYLLLQQQKKQLTFRNSKSMKWHPVMLRWCISIFLKSPGPYEHLRNSKFLVLPHKNTLKKYTNFTEPLCGINTDVLKHLLEEIKEYIDLPKFVGIIFDEMKIKRALVYKRYSGKIVGFSDIGGINYELFEFQ